MSEALRRLTNLAERLSLAYDLLRRAESCHNMMSLTWLPSITAVLEAKSGDGPERRYASTA